MGHRTYDDFELRISTEGDRYRVRAPKAGEAQQFDLDAVTFCERARRLAEAFAGRERLRPDELREAKTFGRDLFEAVFPRPVFGAWKANLPRSGDRARGLRLRLHVEESGHLAAIPWELLYDGAGFLAASAETPVVRDPELTAGIRALAVEPPLRFLAVIPEPLGQPQLDGEGELRAIQEELGPLVKGGLAVVERLEKQTISALRERLSREPPVHVLHFAGHGEARPDLGDGVLLFELQERIRHADPVSGFHLATLFRDAKDLRLVVVNACEGACASETEPSASLALWLLRQGVPAVLALQTPIGNRAAQTLTRTFYREIARHRSLEEAVAEARKELHAGAFGLAWAAPVLYLRAKSGELLLPKSLGSADAEPLVTPQGRPRILLSILAVLALGGSVLWQSLTSKPKKIPPWTPLPSSPACPSPRGLELAFRQIPPGLFEMGAPPGLGDPSEERPAHRVRISQPYCVSAFEVTSAQWDAVMSDGDASIHPGRDLPKVGVSWEGAQGFLERLNERDPTGNYRLLTEAEWEHAARGRSWAAFGFGEQAEGLPDYGNCLGDKDGFLKLAPVGSLKPNSFGLYDVHGNAQEWVADWFGLYAVTKEPTIDPVGPKKGIERVRRGGSFEMRAVNCTSWSRGHSKPDRQGHDFGFRIARSPVGSASRRGTAGSPKPADAARSDRRGDDSHLRARPSIREQVASGLAEEDEMTSPVGSEPAWPPLSINAGLDQIAQAITGNINSFDRKRIAVIPFSWTDGRKTNFEKHLAGALTSWLSKIPTLNLVERSLSAETLKELELAKSQNLEQEQTRKLGRLIQAEILLTGDLTELHDVIDVNTRLIDTETGRLYPSPSTKIFIDEAVRRLMESKPTAPPASASPSATDISRRGFLGR